MNIALWPIENVHPYPRNARRIRERAIDKVAASIREFGWRQPIVVDQKGVVICGHVRLLAARKLGLKEVPVHVADNLIPAQVRAYRLADNRSHEETSWNEELLGLELFDLRDIGFDLNLTGFDLPEMDQLLATSEEAEQVNNLAQARATVESAVSRLGDMWILGNHRLFCCDSTTQTSFERVLDGAQADMVFTEPPNRDDSQQPAGLLENWENAYTKNFEEFITEVCRKLLSVTTGAIYIGVSSS